MCHIQIATAAGHSLMLKQLMHAQNTREDIEDRTTIEEGSASTCTIFTVVLQCVKYLAQGLFSTWLLVVHDLRVRNLSIF